ncbi:MAG: DUF615 domain-containing protein [Desulfamplus sp.]|nr:DUF615 domain-containing protein [Desulfamplus sp.]MBF0258446.1 DUF615 domain-containing protein [Desulfamplus sp.]
MSEHIEEPGWDQEQPSRTRKKKAAQQLQKLGEFLVEMAESEVERLDIPTELKRALSTARSLTKHGAKKRQFQYIGTLMREIDTEPLADVIEKMARTRTGKVTRSSRNTSKKTKRAINTELISNKKSPNS